MSIYGFLNLWISISLLSIPACSGTTLGNQKEKDTTLTGQDSVLHFDLDGNVTGQVSSNLFGFNTANLFMFYEDNSHATELIKELKPKILRFPGGTTANFYHFHEKGYGYRKDDVELVKGSNAYNNAIKSYKAEQKLIASGKVKNNYATEFAQLAKISGSGVVIVANLFSGTDKEILDLIEYFIQSQVEVVGIELGNEYYFKAYHRVFPNVKAYIDRASVLSAKIRKKFPNIPLAAVAASSDELHEVGAAKADMLTTWNEKLSKADFFDAIITHLYSKPKYCFQQSTLKEKYSCSLNANTIFALESLPGTVDYYKQFYGNKPLWITEWNMQGVFEYFGNTFLQMAFYADFALTMTELDNIDIACYHNLLSGGSGFNMIGLKDKDEITKSKDKYLKRTSYFIAELMSPLFGNSVQHLKNPLTLTTEKEKMITVRAFRLSSRELMIFIVNKSAKNYSSLNVKLPLAFQEYKVVTQNQISASELSDGIGKNPVKNGNFLSFDSKVVAGIGDIKIPGLSITRIILSN